MEIRELHLRGALGAARTEMYNGKEHLVVPVVSLMEGVIHAVNANHPEFVTTATLSKAATSWNGRPLVLGHPVKDGRQISANDAKVLEAQGFGTIFNSRMSGSKLLMDAYIDPVKAEKVGGEKFLERLKNGEMVECSVGAFVTTDNVQGSHNGKAYKASWKETTGDHLAFLPNGIGACSIEMGCGAHRSASSYLVTAEGLEEIKEEERGEGMEEEDKDPLEALGGQGSGNFGHAGRPGEQGGSGGEGIAAAHDKAASAHDKAAAAFKAVPKSDVGAYSTQAATAVEAGSVALGATHDAVKAHGDATNDNMGPHAERAYNKAEEASSTSRGRAIVLHEGAASAHRQAAAQLRSKGLKTAEGLDLEVLGGAGSGNFGHEGRPGEKGGSGGGGSSAHSDAAKAHRDAMLQHQRAEALSVEAIDRPGRYQAPADRATNDALKGSAAAKSATKATGTAPYAGEAAHAYAKMAKGANGATRANFHREAVKYHSSAATWHDKVGKIRGAQKGGEMSEMSDKPSLRERITGLMSKLLSTVPDEDLKTLDLYDTPSEAASEEAAELIGYQTLKVLLDQIMASHEEASSIVEKLISDEVEDPTESPQDEQAEEEVEAARLEALQTLCMSMYSALNSVMSLTRSLCEEDSDPAAPPRYMAAKMQDCPTCDGNGSVDGNPCPTCDGEGEIRAAVGARHSGSDKEMIQTVHDHAVSLGAQCTEMKAAQSEEGGEENTAVVVEVNGTRLAKSIVSELKAACRCEEGNDEMNKTETIKALIANKHSDFTAGDEKALEALSEERLGVFHAAAQKKLDDETASLKAAEEKKTEDARAAEAAKLAVLAAKPLTTEEFMKIAPPEFKTLYAREQQRVASRRTELVAVLKTAQDVYSEEDLNAMDLELLEKTAKLAKVEEVQETPSYIGRGLPRSAQEVLNTNAPPDSYAAGLEALRSKMIQ